MDPLRGGGLGLDADRIEVGAVDHPEPQTTQRLGQGAGEEVHPPGDLQQPIGPVVDRVHARRDGEENLRGADVAGGFLPPDVLLAGLQRHAQGSPPGVVFRDADDAAGKVSLVLIPRREEGRVRPPVAQRHAEALRVADRDIGPPRPRRVEQREGQEIGRDGYQRSRGMRSIDHRAVIVHAAIGGGVLQQRADHVGPERERQRVAHGDARAPRLCPGLHHGDGLRVTALVHQVGGSFAAHDGLGQVERFRRGGGLVQQ